MKKSAFIFALIISVFNAAAQSKIEQVVESFNKAILDADSTKLANLTADELSYGHSGGQVDNKKRFIEDLVKGTVDFFTLNISDQTIEVTGDIAVVRHKFDASLTNKGVKADLRLGVLMVWCRNKGGWKLLARQGFRL